MNKTDLDNYITGHWGEDQFNAERDAELEEEIDSYEADVVCKQRGAFFEAFVNESSKFNSVTGATRAEALTKMRDHIRETLLAELAESDRKLAQQLASEAQDDSGEHEQ